MAQRLPTKASDPSAFLKVSLKRLLAQSDASTVSSDESNTVPPTLLLDTLKGLHLTVDEATQRYVAALPSINYANFVESLEFDSKIQRWKLAEAATPLIQLSRNTHISGSNTCLHDGSATVPLQETDSKEGIEQESEEMKEL